MTMSAPLPAQGSLPMELPSMSSPGASRAKTYQLPESSAVWAKAPVPASGPRLSDLLATYDRATSSWRTSQSCLVALLNNQADGLAEYSETWPSAGMMRNGKTYRRQPWALPIAENARGLLPTPSKSDPQLERRAAGAKDLHITKNGTVRNGPSNLGLAGIVCMWPTPTTSMHKGSSPASLTRKSGRDRSRDRLDHALQALEGSGALNPTWVEWLMGFPTAHTDLQPLATP
jgi:hypothetical protein